MHWLPKNLDGMTVLRRKEINATEPAHVVMQTRVVIFQGQDVIRASVDHLPGNGFLTAHRIDRDPRASHVQQ